MEVRLRIPLSAIALLLLAAAAFVAPGFALLIAPAFFLILLLVNGIRPGEQLIQRLRRRHEARPRRRAERTRWTPRVVDLPGRLIASGLAMRPPPAIPVTAS